MNENSFWRGQSTKQNKQNKTKQHATPIHATNNKQILRTQLTQHQSARQHKLIFREYKKNTRTNPERKNKDGISATTMQTITPKIKR